MPEEKPTQPASDADSAGSQPLAEEHAQSSDHKKESGKKPVNNSTSMHIKVYAPFRTYFDGEAKSISAVNDTGPFDILPQHHRFMTILNAGDIVVQTERGEEKIPITHGIMHVKEDKVIVFLDV